MCFMYHTLKENSSGVYILQNNMEVGEWLLGKKMKKKGKGVKEKGEKRLKNASLRVKNPKKIVNSRREK